MLRDATTVQVLVAESYGGTDEPVDTLVASLLGVGAEVLGDALRVKASPSQQLYQAFEEAGTDLAQVRCSDGGGGFASSLNSYELLY